MEDKKKVNKDLHVLEFWLIDRIRTRYKFSKITITTQNGLPLRIERVVENDDPRDDGITQ